MSETTVEPHVHCWRVVSFEALGQVVGYRCRGCGAERFDPPRDEGEETARED